LEGTEPVATVVTSSEDGVEGEATELAELARVIGGPDRCNSSTNLGLQLLADRGDACVDVLDPPCLLLGSAVMREKSVWMA
jgi:hypothetical protein